MITLLTDSRCYLTSTSCTHGTISFNYTGTSKTLGAKRVISANEREETLTMSILKSRPGVTVAAYFTLKASYKSHDLPPTHTHIYTLSVSM